MQPWFDALGRVHEFIWPLIVIALYFTERRMRALEAKQQTINSKLDQLLDAHHLVNGERNASVRLYPD